MRTSPLDARHRALGAKMVAVRRLGDADPVPERARRAPRVPRGRGGVRRLAPRHRRVRAARTRTTTLQWLLTNDLDRIAPGRAQYTHLLDADDAHVVDDIIVWWVEPERFFVMPNASNTDRAARRVDGRWHRGVDAADITATRAVLAVQGPQARAMLATVSRRGGRGAAVRRASGRRVDRRGHRLHGRGRRRDPRARGRARRRCGTRSSRPGSRRPGSARATRCGSKPGCRCTATSSARASRRCRPGSAGSCGWDKGDFRGRERARARRRTAGPRRLLDGLAVRRPPTRAGGRGRARRPARDIGVVTSGNFSPTLGPRHRVRVPAARARARRRGRGRRARQAAARDGREDAVPRAADGGARRDARRPRGDPRDGAASSPTTNASPTPSCSIPTSSRATSSAPTRSRTRSSRRHPTVASPASRSGSARSRRGWGRRASGSRICSCDREYRRSGLGRALLDALRARTDGRVEWAVLDWNTLGHDFYRSLGAAPQDEWTTWRWLPTEPS